MSSNATLPNSRRENLAKDYPILILTIWILLMLIVGKLKLLLSSFTKLQCEVTLYSKVQRKINVQFHVFHGVKMALFITFYKNKDHYLFFRQENDFFIDAFTKID